MIYAIYRDGAVANCTVGKQFIRNGHFDSSKFWDVYDSQIERLIEK